MDKFVLWGSTDGFSEFIRNNTLLNDEDVSFKYLPESDVSKPKNFHRLPTHIKNIQYLDSPDLIIDLNGEPILTIEISREAGTGHNVFQRFARLAAAVENRVPTIYIYPEAVSVYRKTVGSSRWDSINPLIFFALEKLSSIYPEAPALLYYYPSYFRSNPNSPKINNTNKGLKTRKNLDIPVIDNEMKKMFSCINEIILFYKNKTNGTLISQTNVHLRKMFMQSEYFSKGGTDTPNSAPISSTITVPSSAIIDYITRVKNGMPNQSGENYFDNTIWSQREKTIIYKVDAKFRGDPYPGCLAALDYMMTRNGKTYEDRNANLVLAWGDVTYDETNNKLNIRASKNQSIKDLFDKVKVNNRRQDILTKKYDEIPFDQLPRYFMHLRFGSTYSKPKEIRIYSYFSDALLFPDGALWREG